MLAAITGESVVSRKAASASLLESGSGLSVLVQGPVRKKNPKDPFIAESGIVEFLGSWERTGDTENTVCSQELRSPDWQGETTKPS